MIVQHEKYYPSVALSPYIQYYYFPNIDSQSVLTDHKNGFTVMPSTHVRMVLFLSEPTYRKVGMSKVFNDRFGLMGFSITPKTYFSHSPLRQMMVGFSPIGAQQFIDFPFAELTDATATIKDIFPFSNEMLINRLCEAENNLQRVKIAESFFLEKLKKIKPIDSRVHAVIDFINQHSGAKSIKEISNELAIGDRTLKRLVNRHIGINIKLFSRLVRFQKAKELLSEQNESLTSVGYRLGYFDQAHFVHEFSESSGYTPGNYRKIKRSTVGSNFDSGNQIDRQVFI